MEMQQPVYLKNHFLAKSAYSLHFAFAAISQNCQKHQKNPPLLYWFVGSDPAAKLAGSQPGGRVAESQPGTVVEPALVGRVAGLEAGTVAGSECSGSELA